MQYSAGAGLWALFPGQPQNTWLWMRNRNCRPLFFCCKFEPVGLTDDLHHIVLTECLLKFVCPLLHNLKTWIYSIKTWSFSCFKQTVTDKFRWFGDKAAAFMFFAIMAQDLAWNTSSQVGQNMQSRSLGHYHVHPGSQ